MNEHMETQKALMGIKTEGKAVPDSLVKKIADMTHRNAHQEAYMTIAREVLRDKKLAEAFESVLKLQLYFKSLTPPLKKLKDDLYVRMKAKMKAKLSDTDYEKVYQAT